MKPHAPGRARVVFLVDVDNTLLDNDRIVADLRETLTHEVGAEKAARYWSIFEECRHELGYADYLGALQRFRVEDPHDVKLSAISSMLLNYRFHERLYPGAIEAVQHLAQWGTTVILTDGDVVFQPLKIERSGLAEAFGGRVLIYVHKEKELAEVQRRFPAEHYVLIDDKVRILAQVKAAWGDRVTTVFPKQGHYAAEPDISSYPTPDFTIDHIADLLAYNPPPGVVSGKDE
jgi:FMN phosphatase YigB (HAD superfamily)